MPATPGVGPELAALLERLERQGIKPGLDATRELSARLGSPEKGLPVVLVAGTNGKGSTASLLAAMAVAGGYRTGLYTSPHLESPRERIRIDGRAITEPDLLAVLGRVVEAGERTPTYFEAMTVAAFLHFSEREVDLAVLEVGLGGRLDATNVSEPILSVVTSISLDHTELLGDDPAQIAREKAGVFRPGRPALCGPAEPAVAAALATAAREIGASYVAVDDRYATIELRSTGWLAQRVEVETAIARYRLETSLVGRHQRDNVRLAVAAAEALARAGWERLDRAAVEVGARGAAWPARLEWIGRPDREGAGVLLDAAHNPGAIESLDDFLAVRGGPFDLLFGALGDRPAAEMLRTVAERAEWTLLTRPASPRAWWPDARPSAADDRVPDLDRALEVALERRSAPLLVVSGSIFLVGPARAALARRWPAEVEPAVAVDVARSGLARVTLRPR